MQHDLQVDIFSVKITESLTLNHATVCIEMSSLDEVCCNVHPYTVHASTAHRLVKVCAKAMLCQPYALQNCNAGHNALIKDILFAVTVAT